MNNREILFRGKRIDNGEWVYGSFCQHENRTLCAIGDSLKPEDTDYLILKSGFSDWNMPKPLEAYPVITSTVGQFTGLLDRNGKRIFEGDKIYIEEYNEKRTGIIVADLERTGFKIEWLTKTEFNEYIHVRIDNIEVIGTIHD